MRFPVPVGSLTDAELAVLARPRTRVGPRPVMPRWARLDGPGRARAAADARAGLVARRLLEPGTGDLPALRRDLRSVVVLREGARAVVAVARTSPAGGDHWYAHLVGDVALLEQVSAAGGHHFALAATGDLRGLVTAAVLHPAAVSGAGPAADATDWLRADLEWRGGGPPGRRAWVSGPGGTYRVVAGAAPPEQPTTPEQVAQELTAVLATLTSGATGAR